MSSHDPHADYNAIADRVYIEGWALALIFGAVDQGLAHQWPAAGLCAVMSAFCQFVVIRWTAWIRTHPDNALLKSLNTIATSAGWWVVTLIVFFLYLTFSNYAQHPRLPFNFGQSTLSAPQSQIAVVNTTVGRLLSFYRNHLGIEGDKQIAPYIGKWMSVSGIITEITPAPEGAPPEFGPTVFVETHTLGGVLGSVAFLDFAEDSRARIPTLQRDQTITAFCQLSAGNKVGINFKYCTFSEFVPDDATNFER